MIDSGMCAVIGLCGHMGGTLISRLQSLLRTPIWDISFFDSGRKQRCVIHLSYSLCYIFIEDLHQHNLINRDTK